jgi:ribose/xylose/arabinose/galactoside ABC-type transport system permease subunit
MSAAVSVVRRAAAQGQLVWFLALAVAIQASVSSEFFLTSLNVSNATGQMVPLALASMGQMVAILVGAIDLSVGATARVAALLTAGFIDDNPARIIPVIVGVLVVGALIGSINGAMVVRLRFHPLIATLITFNLLSGVALAYTTGPIGGIPSGTVATMRERFLGLPYPVWVVIGLLIAQGTMLTRTRFGRNAYAVGGDAEVARRAGVNADAVRFRMLVLCSMLAAAAGIVLAFRQGVGDPRVGEGLELDSILAVVIGGVSIFGGRGSLLGVLGGVVFLNILRNAMNLQGVDDLLQRVVSAALVIVAVVLFTRRDE